MVLLPDRVGGRKAVVKQGVAMEGKRDEGNEGKGGWGGEGREMQCTLGLQKGEGDFFFPQFVLQMFPPCALPLAQEIRN